MAVDESALEEAAENMLSPVKPTREAAERTLLSAREEAAPHLARAIVQGLAVERLDSGILGRIALLLGALRARDGLPALFQAVDGDVGHDDRALVARAIAEVLDGRDAFDDRARGAVEALAADDNRYVRAFAAQAFAAMGDPRSRARIEALAEDGDSFVRDAASRELRKLNAAAAEAESSGTGLDDFAALVDAANSEGGRLKPWLDDLSDGRRAVRDAAVAALIRAGKESVPFLIEQLNQPSVLPRIGAAQALGSIQSPEAAGPLLIAATNPASTDLERELIPVALRALANCLTGVEEGLSAGLLPLARDGDRFVRAAALLCLGRIADRAGIVAVVEALTDDDPFVVESASIALSEGVREEDTALILPLLGAYDDSRGKAAAALREAILIALSRIAIEDPPLKVRVRHRVRRELSGPTAALRKASVALLERLHDDDDPPVLPVVDEVVVRLRDSHPEVRVVAASFLSRHLPPGFTGAVPRLIDAVLRKEKTLALLACEALRRHDTVAARDALEAITRSEDSAVALRAAELVDGWSPRAKEWTFEPKVARPTPARGRTEAQKPKPEPDKPSRVRAVTDEDEGAAVDAKPADDDVVEANFGDDDDERPDEPTASP
jgi:HEAT repeat protein